MILFTDIDDQRILQSDWMKSTTATSNQKVAASHATFLWWLSPIKNLRDQSIPSKDIIKKSWARTTTGQSHPPKVVFSDAAFPWWITSCKKAKTSLDSFQRYWWSNNSAIWLAKKHDWQTQPKQVVPDATFAWWLSPSKNSKRLQNFFQRY